MTNDEVKPDSNQMALDRTWLAHERTLMAWVRTATSMISFGFTIYKFFQFEAAKEAQAAHRLLTPRDFALIMVSIGVLSLVVATIARRIETREVGRQLGRRVSLAEVVAAILGLFGLVVLLSAILHR